MNTDLRPGNGTEPGSCTNNEHFCRSDGTCGTCAVKSTLPHSGCTELNPVCKQDTSECTCDPTTSSSSDLHYRCTSETASMCDDPGHAGGDPPYKGGTCKCGISDNFGDGTGSMCDTSSRIPKCVNSITATKATCQVNPSQYHSF